MPQDVVLERKAGNFFYDFSLDADGQIVVDDFFDTALLYSVLGEQRADSSEVSQPERRRGWIGNEGKERDNGSKLWLFHQSAKTRTVLNDMADALANCVKWLVEDGFAISIDDATATATKDGTDLEVTIRRSTSVIIKRSFKLWNNTGIR